MHENIAARAGRPTLREETAALDDDAVFDMANLTEAQTGVPGVITITTEVGQHGPKVRYSPRLGQRELGCAVSVEPEPRVLFGDLDESELRTVADRVVHWVALNREALATFWREGAYWMIDEVHSFVARLKKV